MLIEFKVENFYSIKEPIVFSMVAGPDNVLDYNVITHNKYKKNKILKSAVIYGANASGKTNVIRALNVMEKIILENNNRQKGDRIKVIPFKLDEVYKNKPTKFDIIFIHDDTKYAYGFVIDQEKVHSEYLYFYPNGRQSTIFERITTNQYKFTKDKEEQEVLSKRTISNRLYLGNATEWNYEPCAKAFEWFKEMLRTNISGEMSNWADYTASLAHQNKTQKEAIKCLLSEADLNIQDYITEEKDLDEDPIFNNLTDKLKETIKSEIDLSDFKLISVKTTHTARKMDGTLYEEMFNMSEESSGTQKIFQLSGPLLDVLAHGYILIIDELDIRLHPLLVENIVKKFHDPKQNPKNAQLIFTTHNTNLLTQTLFRRDQIWFTEKDTESSSTNLYSLLDLGVRKDENLEKGYLAGRYGAIPFIGEESICRWPE
ncbi:ATP-binding protein [Sporomusa sphaeroides]|uniref:AAA family ATPase n=1 Tax=Sporomusa sphaeroides TaxID=47679 RepID=UPI003158EEBD